MKTVTVAAIVVAMLAMGILTAVAEEQQGDVSPDTQQEGNQGSQEGQEGNQQESNLGQQQETPERAVDQSQRTPTPKESSGVAPLRKLDEERMKKDEKKE